MASNLLPRLHTRILSTTGEDGELLREAATAIEAGAEKLKVALHEMRNCVHDGGFDREFGPVGCLLGDKCVCIGVYPIVHDALDALSGKDQP